VPEGAGRGSAAGHPFAHPCRGGDPRAPEDSPGKWTVVAVIMQLQRMPLMAAAAGDAVSTVRRPTGLRQPIAGAKAGDWPLQGRLSTLV